jgi:hypothetical protein
MPTFEMTYPYGRYFPSLGVTLAPGETITADENPDGNFFADVNAPAPKLNTQPPPHAPPEPEPEPPADTPADPAPTTEA